MSIQAMTNIFEGANVTGRFTQAHLTPEGLTQRAVGRALRNRDATGLQAVVNRVVINTHMLAAMNLTFDRILSPLQLLQAASIKNFVPGLYPVAEAVIGRGTRPTTDLRGGMSAPEKVHALWQRAVEHGVMGSVLEVLPMRMAGAAQARGATKMAQVCIAGAILGRCALQVPRAVVVMWAISENILFLAVVNAALLTVEGGARSARWVIEMAHPRVAGTPLSDGRQALDRLIDGLSRHALMVAADVAHADDLGKIAPPARNEITHQSVADRTNAAMRRFLAIPDPDAEGGREVRETADAIANDLRNHCANAQDPAALRGGLSLLNTMMELTYEEANWPKPPELN